MPLRPLATERKWWTSRWEALGQFKVVSSIEEISVYSKDFAENIVADRQSNFTEMFPLWNGLDDDDSQGKFYCDVMRIEFDR